MRFKFLDPGPSVLPIAFGALLAAGAGLAGCQADETTGPGGDAKITLLSPQGGETFKVGDTLRIKWTVKDDPDPVSAVDPMLSPDSGKTWSRLSQSIDAKMKAWGNFGWKIPDTLTIQLTKYPLAGNSKVLVRVKEYTSDELNKQATIKRPITIVAP